MNNKATFSLLLFLFMNHLSKGQDYYRKDSTITQPAKPILMQIKLKDGTTVKGVIKSQDLEVIKIETKNLGDVAIRITDVASITSLNDSESKSNNFGISESPTPNKYFYGPSAFQLKSGQVEYQNIWFLYNHVSYGVTDNLSLGVGLVAGVSILVFTAKVGTKIGDNVRIGAGTLIFTGGTLNSFSTNISGGIYHGVITFGSENKNLSFSLLKSYNAGSAAMNFAGSTRVSDKIALFSDNTIFFETGSANSFSFGVKILGKRTSVDLGIFAFAYKDYYGGSYSASRVYTYPFAGLTVQLGKL